MNYLPWHHSFGGLFERFMSLYNGCELCLDDSRGRDVDRLVDAGVEFSFLYDHRGRIVTVPVN